MERDPREPGRMGSGTVVRVVAVLLGLYPESFRERYGAELVRAFRDGWEEQRARGRVHAFGFLLRTSVSMAVNALVERLEMLRQPRRGAGRVQDETRTPRSETMLGNDIRYALRFLLRSPAFTVAVVLTLALGIGMNTAAFSVLYGALYAPFPYGAADRLVQVGRTHPQIGNSLLPVSPGNYYALSEAVTSVEQLEAISGRSFVYGETDVAARYQGSAVTWGFFDMLAVTPAMGRSFRRADDQPGSEATVVVSDGFWRAQLGADPGVVGGSIRLNDEPYTVIGVMRPEFELSGGLLWVTHRLSEDQRQARQSNYLRMWARLRPGVSVSEAGAELASLWIPIREAFLQGNEDTGLTAETLRETTTRIVRPRLLILAGAAVFVLLIACANVANLLLVRAERRQREVGVRAALGASRGRLARQFLTEGLLLSLIGGLLGLGVGWGGVRALVAAFGNAVPRSTSIAINLPVLLFSLAASVFTGLLVGLAPALRRERDFDVLREGSRGATARFSPLARVLVVAEVALAIMLVTGAGLLLKSYARAMDSDLGFDAENIATASFWFPSSRYSEASRTEAFLERLDAGLRADPRVQGLAMANMVPVRDYGNNYTEIGAVGREAKASFVETRTVTPAFFDALQLQLTAGRTFTDAESRALAGTEVVINRMLAKQLFGDDDPLGEVLVVSGRSPQVIGVVDDVRDYGPDSAPHPTMYFATFVASNLIVRSPLGGPGIADLLRQQARAIDPAVAILRVETMERILTASLAGRRFQLTLLAVFAATALALACVGIYGVLAYSVERQTREIGVRIALGARARRVAWHVAWRGGQLAVLGAVIGGVGTFGFKQAIAAQLFDVEPFDPAVYGAVIGVLLTTAALACFIPARRAAGIDPIRALREDV